MLREYFGLLYAKNIHVLLIVLRESRYLWDSLLCLYSETGNYHRERHDLEADCSLSFASIH